MNVLYGRNLVSEIIKAQRRKVYKIFFQNNLQNILSPEIFSFIKQRNIPFSYLDKKELDKKSKGAHHQGVVIELEDYKFENLDDLDSASLILICDSLKDPQNFGALCRSAYCFGVDYLILPKDRSLSITPATFSTSAGALEHLKVVQVPNLSRTIDKLKEKSFWVYGADASTQETLNQIDWPEKVALVLGEEGKGMRPLIQKKCDQLFSIPMKGDFNSLNVAQAGTISLYIISMS